MTVSELAVMAVSERLQIFRNSARKWVKIRFDPRIFPYEIFWTSSSSSAQNKIHCDLHPLSGSQFTNVLGTDTLASQIILSWKDNIPTPPVLKGNNFLKDTVHSVGSISFRNLFTNSVFCYFCFSYFCFLLQEIYYFIIL